MERIKRSPEGLAKRPSRLALLLSCGVLMYGCARPQRPQPAREPGSPADPTSISSAGQAGVSRRDFSGSVSVRWFGARGDARADDSHAVLEAYRYLAAHGGGKLFFPAGTYRFNLAMNGAQNVSIAGVVGATTFEPAQPKPLFSISGYATVENKIYFSDFGIMGSNLDGETGFYVHGSSIAVENVQCENVGTAVFIDAAIGNDFTRCRFYAKNYAVVERGSADEYAGFNVFDDVEIKAGKCGIFKDNTAGNGNGGGDDYVKVLMEGCPGIFFYGNSSAEYATPDFFHYIWLEAIGTASALDLSDVGGPSRVPVRGDGLFFVNSHAEFDWLTVPFAATRHSVIMVRRYESERGGQGSWFTDDTSLALVNEITTGTGGLALPYSARFLLPCPGYGITILASEPKSALDFSLVNLLGSSGDGVGGYSAAASAGAAVRQIADDSAPVFSRVLEFRIPPKGEVFLYDYGTVPDGDKYNDLVAGRWYAYSYELKVTEGDGPVGPDFTNLLPLEPKLPKNVWLHIRGIYVCDRNAQNRDMLVRNEGRSFARFELSQLEVVEFGGASTALEFLNSNRYAASFPPLSHPHPRWSLIKSREQSTRATGVPECTDIP